MPSFNEYASMFDAYVALGKSFSLDNVQILPLWDNASFSLSCARCHVGIQSRLSVSRNGERKSVGMSVNKYFGYVVPVTPELRSNLIPC